jgi:hypothetical protein
VKIWCCWYCEQILSPQLGWAVGPKISLTARSQLNPYSLGGFTNVVIESTRYSALSHVCRSQGSPSWILHAGRYDKAHSLHAHMTALQYGSPVGHLAWKHGGLYWWRAFTLSTESIIPALQKLQCLTQVQTWSKIKEYSYQTITGEVRNYLLQEDQNRLMAANGYTKSSLHRP